MSYMYSHIIYQRFMLIYVYIKQCFSIFVLIIITYLCTIHDIQKLHIVHDNGGCFVTPVLPQLYINTCSHVIDKCYIQHILWANNKTKHIYVISYLYGVFISGSVAECSFNWCLWPWANDTLFQACICMWSKIYVF